MPTETNSPPPSFPSVPSALPAGRLFCFGLGYTARAVAKILLAQGWRVSGTVRAADGVARNDDLGITPIVFDGRRPLGDIDAVLDGVSHILVSIPPDEDGDPLLALHGADMIARAGALRWVGYLSTVGVYGDAGGGWVDEDAPVRPTQTRSHWRALAEQQWRDLHDRFALPVDIFRLAGIYGPGSSVLSKVRRGRARLVDKPHHRFSRIHVDDIAAVLIAAMAARESGRVASGRVYNVADDLPAEPSEVTRHACALLGVTPPTAVAFAQAVADMSPMARTFWADNRRVCNRRIKDDLGVRLRYPSYREGLRAVLAAEKKADSERPPGEET
ncbi:SDR family oxidoreductase [Varunaivibrio sulfuroxidans]|uniref:Nucleoside-diphosphate-sugar epimerase n=1 Tax=Varunaivibrio sulfuroxidans TaxID=1773489 RepID=A0A4R3J4C1_9PROT|nr:SDR family oxidoreductase [Varunaivibrio sulfuroxidans]TCS60658.1 nucleoside-diphosphate-sugar epimerase [Varunaivibrio sulfuroxidans]WES30149.1 SDR family oxidoreductase [Varunaivibrio sulfuroxidans]